MMIFEKYQLRVKLTFFKMAHILWKNDTLYSSLGENLVIVWNTLLLTYWKEHPVLSRNKIKKAYQIRYDSFRNEIKKAYQIRYES